MEASLLRCVLRRLSFRMDLCRRTASASLDRLIRNVLPHCDSCINSRDARASDHGSKASEPEPQSTKPEQSLMSPVPSHDLGRRHRKSAQVTGKASPSRFPPWGSSLTPRSPGSDKCTPERGGHPPPRPLVHPGAQERPSARALTPETRAPPHGCG